MVREFHYHCSDCTWTGYTAPWNPDLTEKRCPECGNRVRPREGVIPRSAKGGIY